ncbi:DUF1697 domain-containing protein [uncultured Flavobacterium sp.]|uniref:DUF1697 domain-containing protein n=1 Tax=uncultured Flavobacterium sp. TaxID=165435 RepID=UPI0025FB8582|nr:DUF1697 domain-containing protein [uncultured Flavobacterium sp.]
MTNYLALFRGINVSGKNIIRMEGLRRLLEDAGYENVKTYIQSGNVVFAGKERSKEKLAKAIEKLVEEEYGYSISVFVIDKNHLEKAIANNPYAEGKTPEEAGTKKIYVTFLSDKPSAEAMENLKQVPMGADEIAFHDDILYFKLAIGAADSKLSNNLIESRLKLKATTRNWNTTLKLSEMMR